MLDGRNQIKSGTAATRLYAVLMSRDEITCAADAVEASPQSPERNRALLALRDVLDRHGKG